MKREWYDHRAAYAPRLWPSMLVSVIIAVTLTATASLLLSPPPVVGMTLGLGIGALVGWTVARIRWARWRQAHPVRGVRGCP